MLLNCWRLRQRLGSINVANSRTARMENSNVGKNKKQQTSQTANTKET